MGLGENVNFSTCLCYSKYFKAIHNALTVAVFRRTLVLSHCRQGMFLFFFSTCLLDTARIFLTIIYVSDKHKKTANCFETAKGSENVNQKAVGFCTWRLASAH